MIIEQYGIRLKRLTINDIELVRKWRNHPKIQSKMGYRKHISKEQQLRWFHSINNPLNFYFLIEYQGKDIGVINTKNIDYQEKSGEGGIFVWEENLEQEFIPTYASLCLLNFSFFVLGFNKSFIQIIPSNYRAISYNKNLGYVLLPGQEKAKNPYYLLTKEDYQEKTKKINEIARKMTKSSDLPIVFGVFDKTSYPEILRDLLD